MTDQKEETPLSDVELDEKSQQSDPALGDSASGLSTGDDSSDSSGDGSNKFVQRETRHVLMLRVGVLFILLSASAAISLVVFFTTDNGEMESFESSYYAAADKVTGKTIMHSQSLTRSKDATWILYSFYTIMQKTSVQLRQKKWKRSEVSLWLWLLTEWITSLVGLL